jgi:uncharacterized protein
MAAKRTKKIKLRKFHFSILLVFAAMAVYLGVIWFYINQTYRYHPLQSGRLATTQTFTGEDYSKSLDLRIAAKATYPSAPISMVKDLGTSQGFDQQTVSFKVTTDHLTEYGLMDLPTGTAPAGGWPTIILCHGYFNPDQYQTTTGYLTDMTFYVQHGFAVIKPDFRGQGLSLDAGQPDGAYYSMDYNTDVMSLISAVGQTNYLNKNDISLWGHSMGAYIALRAAVLSPQIKNVILISGPVGTVQDMFSDYMAISDKDNPLALKLRETELLKYGTPITDPKFWEATSPLNYLKQLKANVEINVGSDDQTVPPKFSAELDSALTTAGISHQYYVYAGGNHGLIDQRPQIWQRSLDLLTGGTGSQ